MMKTIAILHFPQECGCASLRFVSLETGQVVKCLCSDAEYFDDCYDYEYKEVLGPVEEYESLRGFDSKEEAEASIGKPQETRFVVRTIIEILRIDTRPDTAKVCVLCKEKKQEKRNKQIRTYNPKRDDVRQFFMENNIPIPSSINTDVWGMFNKDKEFVEYIAKYLGFDNVNIFMY